MSISKTGKNKKRCCSPELIAAFLDRRLSAEDDERVLIHLAECQECKKSAAFAGEAIALHVSGLPELSNEERKSSSLSVRKMLQEPLRDAVYGAC